ncbi:HD domain-containing protein [Halobellus rufus]|uniref:HD domain-containing protein n=1 Tax=Halobellus rufus TaxID=1448860 RepID=UPI00067977D8|nr:HD domain-containing protein [Halobellus rufus]
MSEESVRAVFPELDAIADDDLRSGVVEAWTTAMAEQGVDDLAAVPWLPPTQRELGIEDETLVGHVRDVTAGALALAELLTERRGDRLDLDLDVVVAGALVHDVSKLAEFDGMDDTPVYDLLGHPYYGVYVVAGVGLPVELAHIVLSHTSRTNVEPATIEAEIVRRADEVAAAAIRWRATDDLRTV